MCKFSTQRGSHPSCNMVSVLTHECRLLRLLLVCAKIRQGGKAQIFKHEEQSYDVAVGFESIITGCVVISPFLLGKNFLSTCVSNRMPLSSTRQKHNSDSSQFLLWRVPSTRRAGWPVIGGLVWVWVNLHDRERARKNVSTTIININKEWALVMESEWEKQCVCLVFAFILDSMHFKQNFMAFLVNMGLLIYALFQAKEP